MERFTQLPEERVERVLNKEYLAYTQQIQDREVDFAVIPELLRLVQDKPGFERAVEHLLDAQNAQLPLKVRQQHFDLSASLVWTTCIDGHMVTLLSDFLFIWQNAGGI